MNVRGNDLAGIFLNEFVKSIFLVLHPEIMQQNATSTGNRVRTKNNSSKNGEFVSMKPMSLKGIMPFGVPGRQQPIKLPGFNPNRQGNFVPSATTAHSPQRGFYPATQGKLPVPIPSYKIQQYFAKNKEWPTIVVPAKNNEQMMPSLGNKVVSIPQTATQQENTKLDSLIYLLSDPNVSSLECPGPGKPVLLSKSGKMENSDLVLSQEEIKIVMDEVARKTGQKFESGFVKASTGNFVISAVISEFVGTRFVMQKPMQGGA